MYYHGLRVSKEGGLSCFILPYMLCSCFTISGILTVFFFQVHKLIDLFRKEADYWQRRRELEPPPPRFQQVQSRPRFQQTFQKQNHEVCELTTLVAL
jgi:hypothetical protein